MEERKSHESIGCMDDHGLFSIDRLAILTEAVEVLLSRLICLWKASYARFVRKGWINLGA